MRSPWAASRRESSRAPSARARRARPTVLIVVYGACLVLVGVTASAQAGVITDSYQRTAMASVVSDDAALVRTLVNTAVTPSDLVAPGPTQERRDELTAFLGRLVDQTGIVHVELRDPARRVVASDTVLPEGELAPLTDTLARALEAGVPTATLVTADTAGQTGPPLAAASLLRVDLPLVGQDGKVLAVLSAWRDAGQLLKRIDDARLQVVILTLTAAVVLSGVMFLVFRTAQDRISRQTFALIEAARRDPATNLLAHGAIVEALAASLERNRETRDPVTVALLDIDNFRLLNDTLGHATGDEVLRIVASQVEATVPGSASVGRFGPDEFLVFTDGTASDVVPYLEAIRTVLGGRSLRQGDGDPLPITVSAGVAESPLDAGNVTQLLALATQTLASAKAGGGDAIRICQADVGAAETRAFDVFQGLIIAIDTKDRYTKRHSEDVARYSLFIADRMGLDAELRRTIRLAGLLHDVGKIGIPDGVLRKPGRLTDVEYDIVKQHVALGDMIVRDLPDVESVRAGIRHHHERWDGRGYLHGLAGADIPLVARILAVGDAFSAMTTTRPYRKALPTREAIMRLIDSAGTQLDEDIVGVFVEGLERAPDAPLPGTPYAALWTPRSQDHAEVAA